MRTTRPDPDREWRALLERGEIRLQRCDGCGHLRQPPGWICPECLDERWHWVPVSGMGTVEGLAWYLKRIDERFPDVPYNVALVRLDEGTRMLANVEGVAVGDLAVGQRVVAIVVPGRRGGPVVNFRPA